MIKNRRTELRERKKGRLYLCMNKLFRDYCILVKEIHRCKMACAVNVPELRAEHEARGMYTTVQYTVHCIISLMLMIPSCLLQHALNSNIKCSVQELPEGRVEDLNSGKHLLQVENFIN